MIIFFKVKFACMKKSFIVLILLLIPQVVLAGTISLTTSVSTDMMTEESTITHIELLNSGDESALGVQISLLTENFETDTISVGELRPNKPFEGDFDINLKGDINQGRYPIPVLVDYTDANGYPFSSVSPAFLVYKTPTTSKISGLISEVSLSGKESKKLTLSVRNLDDTEHDVDVKLILPREINVLDGEKTVSVGSKQEKSLDFEVSSLSAISGSTYAILASMEYDDDLHYTSFANGIIRINGESKTQESEHTSTLAYIVLFISIVFILVYAYPKYIKRGEKIEKK